MATFINLSNHPTTKWNDAQLDAAVKMVHGGTVIDLAFPQVDPAGDEEYISTLAEEYLGSIKRVADVSVVHIMGEMNFAVALIAKLKENGIQCVASTTKRETVEENGVKISKFNFVRFRAY